MTRTRKSRDDPIKPFRSAAADHRTKRPTRSGVSAPDLSRVVKCPNPESFGMDDLLTLPEAVALHWPSGGPLTVTSLRTAIRRGELAVAVINCKHFTTRRHLADMMTCRTKTRPTTETLPAETPLTGPTTMAEARRLMEMELSALSCPRNPQQRRR